MPYPLSIQISYLQRPKPLAVAFAFPPAAAALYVVVVLATKSSLLAPSTRSAPSARRLLAFLACSEASGEERLIAFQHPIEQVEHGADLDARYRFLLGNAPFQAADAAGLDRQAFLNGGLD